MATINGVYHPTDGDPYDLTGTGSGSGDLGQLAASAAIKAMDEAAAVGASLRRNLTTSDNLNSLRTSGFYGVPSNAIAAAVGMPNGLAGSVLVVDSGNVSSSGLTMQLAWEYPPGGGRTTLYVRNAADFVGGWTPWQSLFPPAETYGFNRLTETSPHIDTMRTAGTYGATNNNVAAAIGLPDGYAGVITVEDSGNTSGLVMQRLWQYMPSAAGMPGGRLMWRGSSTLAGGWGPWQHTLVHRRLTESDHLDNLRTPGQYGVTPNAVAAAVGMPNGLAGTVTVEDSTNVNGLCIQRVWEYTNEGGISSWRGSSDWVGGWGPWRTDAWQGQTPGGTSTDSGLSHAVRVDEATRRRGGSIGTAGKAAVAFRYDHGLGNFRDHILPELRRLGLPWSMAMNPANFDRTENDGVTPTDLQTWCVQDGGEVWNHGMTHTDASTPEALHTEIVESLDLLRTQLPSLAIEGWCVPGVGGTQYDGFGAGQNAARWDTLAGRLILGAHAFATGHWPGRLRPLTGTPKVGTYHYGIESRTLAEVTAMIDEAILTGTGVTVMMHPSLIGEPDKISIADHTAVLEYIAAKRDAGELVVVSMGGLELADARTEWVDNMLPPMGPPATVPAGGTWTRQRSLAEGAHLTGAVRRVEVDIEATTAGTVQIEVEGCGTKTLTLPSGRSVISRPVTIPHGATRCWVQVTPSVSATVHQVSAKAA